MVDHAFGLRQRAELGIATAISIVSDHSDGCSSLYRQSGSAEELVLHACRPSTGPAFDARNSFSMLFWDYETGICESPPPPPAGVKRAVLYKHVHTRANDDRIRSTVAFAKVLSCWKLQTQLNDLTWE